MIMPVPKEALRELSRAGEAYRFLLSERDLAVIVLSENVEDCNEAACQLFGVTRDEFIGRSPLDFAPPYQPDGSPSDASARERLASALAGLPQWCTWQYRRNDGKLVDTIVHVEAVSLDGVRRVLIRIRDVSRLEKAEHALADNETQMNQILDNTTTAIVFAKDLAGRYLFVNRAFERIVGLPQREIVGKTTAELFPAETAATLMANDARVVAEGNTITVEEQVTFGGRTHTLLTNKFSLLDAPGRPYATCGIAADITERKLTEEALRRAALAVSVAAGEDVFRELVGALAAILGVEMAFIALHKPGAQHMLKMLAFQVDGKWIDDFEYPIAGTPCEEVIGQQYRVFPSRLGEVFELKGEFRKMDLQSYAGVQLNDAHGRSLGIMTVLSRRPLPDPDLVESMLKIFAARAVTEIERTRADAALRTAEASYRAIFESAQDPIFVHDWDTGAVLDVNSKAGEVYGYTYDELKAISIDAISSGEPPYTAVEAGRWLERAKSEGAVEFEWHRKNRDGTLHWDEVRLKSAVIGGQRRVLAFVREITERKLAEAQLRASEEQYRAIFNGSADALMLWNSSLQRVDVNPAYERIYGYSREEVLGGAYLEAPSTEEAERRRGMVRRTLAGEPWHAEIESVRKNGEPVHVEVRTMAIKYAGEPHVLAIVRDVTERRRAGEELRQSEARYRLLFEVESDTILLIDAETLGVLDANRAAAEMYGYTHEELLAIKATDLSVESADTAESIHRHTGSLRIPLRRHRRKDGTEILVEITSTIFHLSGRKVLLATIRDITERRQAIEALQSSEEQYRAIFNASTDALVLWNSEQRRVDINPAYERMYGFSRDEVLSEGYPGHLPPESVEERKALIRRTLAGESIHAELESVSKEGKRFHIEVDTTPIRYRGEPHVLSVVRDITERKRAEAERSRLEAQLRQAQKMEAIGQLTGGIAHDFNNILTSILGYIVLGAERQSAIDDTKLGKYLDQAQRAAQRARDLIQQMLTFSRGQRGERRALALAPLVTESVKLLHSSMPATIELDTELADSVSLVLSDPVQIEQVLLNLCINARDAMNGAGQIRVGVRQVVSDGAVCASCRQKVSGRLVELSVADAGGGIAPDVLDRMFEPFFTTKEVGRGSGMGLAMVHGIVHDHGGHIIVDTGPGGGTAFRLWFAPVEDSRAGGRVAAREQGASTRQRPQLAGRVLVVDDEEMVGDFMAEMLANWGLDVTVKRNPVEAEVWFGHDPQRVDLVITDQTMPRLTGIELAQRLTGIRPDLPVILYTGYSDAVSDTTMAQSGIRALLKKPVDTERLLALLRAHLSGARAAVAAAPVPRAAPKRARGKAPAKSSARTTRKAPVRKRAATSRRASR